jgi:hypothetical protein
MRVVDKRCLLVNGGVQRDPYDSSIGPETLVGVCQPEGPYCLGGALGESSDCPTSRQKGRIGKRCKGKTRSRSHSRKALCNTRTRDTTRQNRPRPTLRKHVSGGWVKQFWMTLSLRLMTRSPTRPAPDNHVRPRLPSNDPSRTPVRHLRSNSPRLYPGPLRRISFAYKCDQVGNLTAASRT